MVKRTSVASQVLGSSSSESEYFCLQRDGCADFVNREDLLAHSLKMPIGVGFAYTFIVVNMRAL